MVLVGTRPNAECPPANHNPLPAWQGGGRKVGKGSAIGERTPNESTYQTKASYFKPKLERGLLLFTDVYGSVHSCLPPYLLSRVMLKTAGKSYPGVFFDVERNATAKAEACIHLE
jgi:hypothetical protein